MESCQVCDGASFRFGLAERERERERDAVKDGRLAAWEGASD
jgi:hypothetical protein